MISVSNDSYKIFISAQFYQYLTFEFMLLHWALLLSQQLFGGFTSTLDMLNFGWRWQVSQPLAQKNELHGSTANKGPKISSQVVKYKWCLHTCSFAQPAGRVVHRDLRKCGCVYTCNLPAFLNVNPVQWLFQPIPFLWVFLKAFH